MPSHRRILPPPSALGFSAVRFPSFRPTQTEAIFDTTESTYRVRILNAPTGVGKTLIALTTLVLEQARGLILTSTKALQDVYAEVGRDIGVADVRGASNYKCPALEPRGEYSYLRGNRPATADHGPCLTGAQCALKAGGCPRYDALRAARSADIVVSNYDYWLTTGKSMQRRGETDADEGLGEFDYIILDELHAAESHVAKALHVDLGVSMIRNVLGHDPISTSASVEEWREWGRMLRVALAGKLDRIVRELRLAHEDGGSGIRRELIDELNTLRGLDRSLSDLGQMYGRWIVERVSDGKLSLDPVWTDRYAEKLLFRGIPVVVGMSATVVPATLRYLGIEKGMYDFFEYASPFDVRRRPIYVWPIVRMHYNMTDGDKRAWADATDELLSARLDRKILIPTVSYKRARELQQLSTHAESFVMHDPRSTKDAVERFRKMPPPAVFVSPSVSTGWDFPDDDVRTIIVAKTPYPSRESAVMQARIASDRTYQDVYAATEFSQTVGRHVRSESDWGETIVTDAAFGGLMKGEKWRYIAKYIRQAITFVNSAPKPLKIRQ